MTVSFRPVQLGDRYRTARGWLVIAYGAVRGIVSEMPDGRGPGQFRRQIAATAV
jgi:hypothetical protein